METQGTNGHLGKNGNGHQPVAAVQPRRTTDPRNLAVMYDDDLLEYLTVLQPGPAAAAFTTYHENRIARVCRTLENPPPGREPILWARKVYERWGTMLAKRLVSVGARGRTDGVAVVKSEQGPLQQPAAVAYMGAPPPQRAGEPTKGGVLANLGLRRRPD